MANLILREMMEIVYNELGLGDRWDSEKGLN